MITGNVGIKENTSPTKKIATNTISEDGVSKELGRSVLNNSSGVEITHWPVTQQGTWSISLNAGSNAIGGVTQSGTWGVGITAGTNSIGSVSLNAGTNTIGTVNLGTTSQASLDGLNTSITTLNTSISSLIKHIAIQNILMSEMTDGGRLSLKNMLADPTLQNY